MPGGDQTGPEGMGPMTGRQMGDCADSGAQGPAGVPMGRAWGWRRGRGERRHRHMRPGFGPRFGRAHLFGHAHLFGRSFRLTQEQEVEVLKDEAEWLKEQLDAVNQRLEKMQE